MTLETLVFPPTPVKVLPSRTELELRVSLGQIALEQIAALDLDSVESFAYGEAPCRFCDGLHLWVEEDDGSDHYEVEHQTSCPYILAHQVMQGGGR